MPEKSDPVEEEVASAEEPRRSRIGRLARRLMDARELSGDAKELVGAMLETSDRAKTEIVRMTAREVRNYLQELRLKDDLLDLVTSHSLELHVSMSLKPLAKALGGAESEPAASSPSPEPPLEE